MTNALKTWSYDKLQEAVVKKVMKGKEFYPALTEGVNEAKDKDVAKTFVAQSMKQMANVKIRR